MSEPNELPCPEQPRRSTRFKPGQSGNPLGRPKRTVETRSENPSVSPVSQKPRLSPAGSR